MPVLAQSRANSAAPRRAKEERRPKASGKVAGPRADRLADAAAALFADRDDSVEIREVREPGDPDAEAYAEGAALPNPGAKLAGPSFEDWLAAA